MVVALIPARGGSKGVPRKNLREVGGKPLIAYSIQAALCCSAIDRVVVSTDSEEIKAMALDFGAEVPFLRPAEIAQDKSTDLEFVQHALAWFKDNEDLVPDLLVHLRPTTPLRDPAVIADAIQSLRVQTDATALRSVHEMSETAYKSFEVLNGQLVTTFERLTELDAANRPRQMFPKTYLANGYVDVLRVSHVKQEGKLHGNHVAAFVTEPSIEIDTFDDLERMEFEMHRNPSFYQRIFQGEKNNGRS